MEYKPSQYSVQIVRTSTPYVSSLPFLLSTTTLGWLILVRDYVFMQSPDCSSFLMTLHRSYIHSRLTSRKFFLISLCVCWYCIQALSLERLFPLSYRFLSHTFRTSFVPPHTADSFTLRQRTRSCVQPLLIFQWCQFIWLPTDQWCPCDSVSVRE